VDRPRRRVSAVLDLMIHDLRLMHQMIPGQVADVEAHRATRWDDSPTRCHDYHLRQRLGRELGPAIGIDRRACRAALRDGVVEIATERWRR